MVLSTGQFHQKGGTDVPVLDGGTGASADSTARTNLGVTIYDTATHDAHDHSSSAGVPAAEAFTSGVHAGTSHAGIPGVGGISIGFGANFATAGRWARVNGEADSVEVTGLSSLANAVVTKAGTSLTIGWDVTASGATMQIFKNNSGPHASFVLSALQGTATVAVSFLLGDRIALTLNTGTAPGIGQYQMLLS